MIRDVEIVESVIGGTQFAQQRDSHERTQLPLVTCDINTPYSVKCLFLTTQLVAIRFNSEGIRVTWNVCLKKSAAAKSDFSKLGARRAHF